MYNNRFNNNDLRIYNNFVSKDRETWWSEQSWSEWDEWRKMFHGLS